jgi:predicted transcriptional regulator
MRDFVKAFHNQLSKEQVRHLIAKLEEEKLLSIIKAPKYTRYTLNYDTIELNDNIYSQFLKKLSE